SCETGAQNCEREPASDSASVDRCLPAAISRSTPSRPSSVADAAITCEATTCITYTIAVDEQPDASSSATAANVRAPSPPPPSCRGAPRPGSPARLSASTLSSGKRPSLSTAEAYGANTSRASDVAEATYFAPDGRTA